MKLQQPKTKHSHKKMAQLVKRCLPLKYTPFCCTPFGTIVGLAENTRSPVELLTPYGAATHVGLGGCDG